VARRKCIGGELSPRSTVFSRRLWPCVSFSFARLIVLSPPEPGIATPQAAASESSRVRQEQAKTDLLVGSWLVREENRPDHCYKYCVSMTARQATAASTSFSPVSVASLVSITTAETAAVPCDPTTRITSKANNNNIRTTVGRSTITAGKLTFLPSPPTSPPEFPSAPMATHGNEACWSPTSNPSSAPKQQRPLQLGDSGTPCAMSSSFGTDASTAQAAVAAAAARRKRRRKALQQSRRNRQQKRRKTVPPADTTSTDTARTATPTTTTSEETTSTSSAVNAAAVIPPTVRGIQQVSRMWLEGRAVAVPTECTYETASALVVAAAGTVDQQQPHRRRHVYVHSNLLERMALVRRSNDTVTGTITSSSAYLPLQKYLQSQLFPQRKYALKKPASTTIRNVDANTDSGNNIASNVQHQQEEQSQLQSPEAPQSQIAAVCCFSESLHIVRRLAAKVWPGPVAIHVATRNSSSNINDNASTAVANTINGRNKEISQDDYVSLRSPCHPLSVKLYQEYYRQQQQEITDAAASKEEFILFGCPTELPNFDADTTTSHRYATSASQVLADRHFHRGSSSSSSSPMPPPSAVLDGEHQHEIFAVPTCERGRRPVDIWVDERRRTVTVRGVGDNGCAGSSSENDNGGDPTPAGLLRALRSPPQSRRNGKNIKRNDASTTTKASAKDRLIQSVLCKWTVVVLRSEEELA